MFVFTVFARAKSPEDARALCSIYGHLLTLRQEPGYLRTDCAINVDDSRHVVIVEYWGSIAALRGWLASEERRRAWDQASPHLEGPVQTGLFEIQS